MYSSVIASHFSHFQRQALPRVLVGNRQPLQRPARRRAVMDEVPGPNMVLVLSSAANATVAAVAQTPLFHSLFRHLQSLPTPQPIDPLLVHRPTLLTKLRRNHPITVTRIPGRQGVHPRHQPLLFLRIFPRLITLRGTWLTKNLTSPTLRHVLTLANVLDRLSTPRRAQ